jgi:hypothetical protein
VSKKARQWRERVRRRSERSHGEEDSADRRERSDPENGGWTVCMVEEQ